MTPRRVARLQQADGRLAGCTVAVLAVVAVSARRFGVPAGISGVPALEPRTRLGVAASRREWH